MASEDLTSRINLPLSLGHLIAAWDILANKLSGTSFMESLTEDEKRAVWALEDLCERSLVENGVSSRPEAEWNALVDAAKAHVRSTPVEHLE
jgi:hypothetical protein